MKLDGPDRKVLMEYFHPRLDRAFSYLTDAVYTKYRNVLITHKQTDLTDQITKYIWLEMGSLLMDVYLLARLVYYSKSQQKTGGVSVVYVGDFHRTNYVEVLSKIYGQPSFNRNHTIFIKSARFRCVDLSPHVDVTKKTDLWPFIQDMLKKLI